MEKGNDMTHRELFDYIDNNDTKFYKKWYSDCCHFISNEIGKNMSEGDCLTFLHNYFNQIKNGECN